VGWMRLLPGGWMKFIQYPHGTRFLVHKGTQPLIRLLL
jgi:hypothetical protein